MYRWNYRDYHRMPWKNGGGVTTELARFPQDANTDQLIWRLSRAEIKASGPFSYFAHIDRSLALLSGRYLKLQVSEQNGTLQEVLMDEASLPFRFLGEMPVFAMLEHDQDSVLNLNFMSRRTVCHHYMQRLDQGVHDIQASDAQQLLIYCVKGIAELHLTGKANVYMQEEDLILLDEDRPHAGIHLRVIAPDSACLYSIRISYLSATYQRADDHAYLG